MPVLLRHRVPHRPQILVPCSMLALLPSPGRWLSLPVRSSQSLQIDFLRSISMKAFPAGVKIAALPGPSFTSFRSLKVRASAAASAPRI